MKLTILSKISTLLLLLTFVLFISACEDDFIIGPDYSSVPEPWNISNAEKLEFTGGIVTYVIEKGDGRFEFAERDRVMVRFTGRDISGNIFGSSWQNGNTGAISVDFGASSSGSINSLRGVKIGMKGMIEGERRAIIIPPEHGFISTSSQFHGDSLRVDIELVEIIE